MTVRTWTKLTIAGTLLVGGVTLAGCTSPSAGPSAPPATASSTPSSATAASSTPSPTSTVPPYDAASAERLKKEQDEVGTARFTAPDYKPGEVRHVVLFTYKPGTSQDIKDQIVAHYQALATKAVRDGKPYMVSFEYGTQISGKMVGKNMDYGFISTFSSEGDRNYFVGTPVVTDPNHFDPEHAAFKKFVGPYLEDEVVFDYVAR